MQSAVVIITYLVFAKAKWKYKKTNKTDETDASDPTLEKIYNIDNLDEDNTRYLYRRRLNQDLNEENLTKMTKELYAYIKQATRKLKEISGEAGSTKKH